MRFYKQQHRYYAGVDLHARSMFTHILDADGNTVFEKDLCDFGFRISDFGFRISDFGFEKSGQTPK